MNLQVLVAAMNQKVDSLLENMNIQSSAIIGNQCDINEVCEFSYKGHQIKCLSFRERGVGLNRNNTLMRATSDICVLADDDLRFKENYAEIVEKHFNENPNCDVIIFNLEGCDSRYIIKKKFKVGYKNFMRFGAARIAFRRKSITKNGITFNLHFGGGTEYSAGEDTLFLHDCLRKGLKIVAVPDSIATLLENRESTWFKGYTDKYFLDRGALFAAISKKWAPLLCLQYAIRKRRLFIRDKSWFTAFKLMLRGAKEFHS